MEISNRSKAITAVITIILMLTGLQSLSALTWEYWSPEASLSYQINSQIGTSPQGKYPSVLLFTPGVSFFADFDGKPGKLFYRPGFWLSWNIEDVYKGIARPCDEAEAGHMKVAGIMLDSPFGYYLELGKADLLFQGGPALYIRIPLYTAQSGTGKPKEFWKAYYGAAQFLHLGAAILVQFPVSSKTTMQTGIRYYQPLSNLWTKAPFDHGINIGITASINFNFQKKAKESLPDNPPENSAQN